MYLLDKSPSYVLVFLSLVKEVYVQNKQTFNCVSNGLKLTLFLHGQFLKQFLSAVSLGDYSRRKKQGFPGQSFKVCLTGTQGGWGKLYRKQNRNCQPQ